MGTKLHKTEMVKSLAESTGKSQTEVGEVLDHMLLGMTAALKEGRTVALGGFGTFTPKVRAARTGRNPRTGEAVAIPEKNTVGFKLGKTVSDTING